MYTVYLYLYIFAQLSKGSKQVVLGGEGDILFIPSSFLGGSC